MSAPVLVDEHTPVGTRVRLLASQTRPEPTYGVTTTKLLNVHGYIIVWIDLLDGGPDMAMPAHLVCLDDRPSVTMRRHDAPPGS